jgi:hypothetical protein
MRKLLLAITMIGFCATARAQRMTHDHSPGDIYIGYSLLNGDAFSTASGFEAALTGNINDWFGLKADFSGNYKSQGGAHAHEFNMLFGPQVSTKGERLRLFLINA